MPITPAYQGEAQLIRWGDGAQGHTVTLRLSNDDPAAVNPFKGLPMGENGQRLQVVCVLVDDNEDAINPDQVKANRGGRLAASKGSPQSAGGRARAAALSPEKRSDIASGAAKARWSERRSNLAAIKCKEDEAFGIWIAETYPAIFDKHYYAQPGFVATWEAADLTIKEVLGIASKRELDVPGPAADAFDRMIASYDNRSFAR